MVRPPWSSHSAVHGIPGPPNAIEGAVTFLDKRCDFEQLPLAIADARARLALQRAVAFAQAEEAAAGGVLTHAVAGHGGGDVVAAAARRGRRAGGAALAVRH